MDLRPLETSSVATDVWGRRRNPFESDAQAQVTLLEITRRAEESVEAEMRAGLPAFQLSEQEVCI